MKKVLICNNCNHTELSDIPIMSVAIKCSVCQKGELQPVTLFMEHYELKSGKEIMFLANKEGTTAYYRNLPDIPNWNPCDPEICNRLTKDSKSREIMAV